MNLRQAAEMALKYFEDAHGLEDTEVAIKEALRQALDLQTAIERGTKAWADVPDATEWVDDLRGHDTPEETFTLDRGCYERGCVAYDERDGDSVTIKQERVHKSDKSMHEPEGWVKIDEVRKYFDSVGCGTIYKTAGEDRVPLYTAPPKKEWVGLTKEDFYKKDDETVFVLGMKFAEARLKEKNT